MSFEQAMKQLEDIIEKLQSGEVKFDEALALYEQGASLCKYLTENFKTAKGRITKVTEILGSIIEEDFN